MANLKKESKIYDAVIVGSGAGGGTAAYVLTQAWAIYLILVTGPPMIGTDVLKTSVRRLRPTLRN